MEAEGLSAKWNSTGGTVEIMKFIRWHLGHASQSLGKLSLIGLLGDLLLWRVGLCV